MTRIPGKVSPEVVGTTSLQRHDPLLMQQLEQLPDVSSAVADALDEIGRGAVIPQRQLAALRDGSRIIGQAVTLRYRPLDGDVSTNRKNGQGTILGDRDLYGYAQPGDVAVMEASSFDDAAVIGGISAAWAAKAEVGGCVIDGLIRDTESILDSNVPVWSAGRTARAVRYRAVVDAINQPVVIASATVHPGDYIVADRDAVCVVPFDVFPEIVRLTRRAQQAENDLMARINESNNLEELIQRTGSAQYL